MTGFIFI